MRRWLQEPLLHFAVLGAALFAAYAVVRPSSPTDAEIVVTAGHIESLTAQFTATWQRAPTDDEMRAIVDGYVRDEVLYREGLALGLDRDDPVVRNRVKQKMEFVGLDTLVAEPTEADLAAYFKAHPADFEIPPMVTFEQVYFDPARRGANLDRDIRAALASLRQAPRSPAASARAGDATMLPARMDGATPRAVAAGFGDEFARSLSGLDPGAWHGPVRSTYGLHLVRIESRSAATMPSLADARYLVAREWTRSRSAEVREQFYRSLRQRYTVTIEPVATVPRSGRR